MSKSQIHNRKNSKTISPVQALLSPFRVTEESSSALEFARSAFSPSVVAISLSTFTRHADMAFTATCLHFYPISTSLIVRFPYWNDFTSQEGGHTLSPPCLSVARKPCCSATPAKVEIILTSIPGSIAPVAKRLLNSKLRHGLRMPSSSSQKPRAPCPCTPSQLWNVPKPRSRSPRPSLSRCSRSSRPESTNFATKAYRFQILRSIKLKMNWCDWTSRKKCDWRWSGNRNY